MSKSVVIAVADTAELEAKLISPDWVLNGRPETRSKQLARSTSCAMVWDCTAGHFNWHYNKDETDETIVVLTGEAFISTEKGQERRIGPGEHRIFPSRDISHMACYQLYPKGGFSPAHDAASIGIWCACLELAPSDSWRGTNEILQTSAEVLAGRLSNNNFFNGRAEIDFQALLGGWWYRAKCP